MSNALKTVAVNFAAIEADITSGNRVTTKDLAKAYLVSPVTMRKMLENHFGNRIGFKRGRTGGIVLDGADASVPAYEPTPPFPYGMD